MQMRQGFKINFSHQGVTLQVPPSTKFWKKQGGVSVISFSFSTINFLENFALKNKGKNFNSEIPKNKRGIKFCKGEYCICGVTP